VSEPAATAPCRRGSAKRHALLAGSLVMLGVAALALWTGWEVAAGQGHKAGGVLLLAASAVTLTACGGLLRLLRSRRLERAAGRAYATGQAALAGWPDCRERRDKLVVRCGHPSLRFWVTPAGLGLSAALLQWLGSRDFSPGELVLSLMPAAALMLLAGAWGPSGWKLTLDGACQSLTCERFGPFRRVRDAAASLPTVQTMRVTEARPGRAVLTVGLTRGMDWQLDLPADWPPELGRALAARLRHLAGINETGLPEEAESAGSAAAPGKAEAASQPQVEEKKS